MPASCHDWLRPGNNWVKNGTSHFTSIVNCSGWHALLPVYTDTILIQLWIFPERSNQKMSATSGDDVGDIGKRAESPAAATRSLAMRGNRIESRELFAAEREIIIGHGDDIYRLRLTSQNKLILTK